MAFANLTSVLKKIAPAAARYQKTQVYKSKAKSKTPPKKKKTRVQQMKQITLTVYPQSVSM